LSQIPDNITETHAASRNPGFDFKSFSKCPVRAAGAPTAMNKCCDVFNFDRLFAQGLFKLFSIIAGTRPRVEASACA
jgi:hypothetical protein